MVMQTDFVHALRAQVTRAVDTRSPEDAPTLSFVIPVYNESVNVVPLARRIVAASEATGVHDFEVIFVENGSRDATEAMVRDLHRADPRMKMVQLSRNFGYQGGLTAGLMYARGEWVAVLDGDQQDPPELIPRMLAKAQEGFEVVYGVRRKRKEGFLQRLAYRAFYRLWRMTANIEVPLDASEFAVLHRKVVDVMTSMPERQRFNRGLRAWTGFRQAGFEYDRDARYGGESKFGLLGNVSLAMDGLFAYSIIPIRLTILLGLLVTSTSVVIAFGNTLLWLLRLFDPAVQTGTMARGLTQINLVFSLLFGMILLCLGVIGEYVGRVYEEVKNRPLFVVRDVLL
jgi:dolichol-phosphate mannosyltransferase